MQRICLHQHAFQFNNLQHLTQHLGFADGIGGVRGLSDRNAQALEMETYLGNEFRCPRVGFSDVARKRLAVTDQGVVSRVK
jgi:hypothetical protein